MQFGALFQMPTNEEEWKQVAEKFNELWHIPNCGGAIDGKHIRIIHQRTRERCTTTMNFFIV